MSSTLEVVRAESSPVVVIATEPPVPRAPRTLPWKPVLVFTLLAAMGAAAVAMGALPKLERRREVVETTARLNALTKRVQVAAARTAPPTRVMSLPASIQPDMRADVFAQATGYIAKRSVDIGDRVHEGDVLAEIDTPLIDQDLRRAKAALAEAVADRIKIQKSLDLARTTLERWKSIRQSNAVSQQEVDERQAAYDALSAAVDAAQASIETRHADVARLDRELAFGKLVAPFDGVITARTIEVGDYVTGAGATRIPLFSIARTDVLRVYIDVPQAYAYSVHDGQTVDIVARELAGKKVRGTVTRTSGALDERTRTLRTEIHIDNAAGALLAGTYATVQFQVSESVPAVIVPGSALIVRAEGPRVAVVDDHGRIQYQVVRVGRDLGTEVEIVGGLDVSQTIVVNLADEIPAGTEVEAVMPKPPGTPKPVTSAENPPKTHKAPA